MPVCAFDTWRQIGGRARRTIDLVSAGRVRRQPVNNLLFTGQLQTHQPIMETFAVVAHVVTVEQRQRTRVVGDAFSRIRVMVP